MSWKELLAQRKVQRHQTSKQELLALRSLIARDLADAAIEVLSTDRRFATAYNAALQTSKMAIACSGYRVASGPGHHRLTFEIARDTLGASASRSLDYFETCRRKRNIIDYAFAATDTEAKEILAEARKFYEAVERWIERTTWGWLQSSESARFSRTTQRRFPRLQPCESQHLILSF